MSKNQRIRGRKLQWIRKTYFAKFPFCEECLKEKIYISATELDHIIAITNGGEDSPNPFVNRQGLCKEHHDKKTKIDLNYKPRVKIGLDGFPIES